MTKIVVFHRGYGCDTGCCGHAIEIDGEEVPGSFQFDHPFDDGMGNLKKWAEEFVRDQMGSEHIADLDWDNCVIVDD